LNGNYREQKKYWAITAKATTEFGGRTYVTWYATEISIAGPYKFHGAWFNFINL
jgi:GLPGLI family protein